MTTIIITVLSITLSCALLLCSWLSHQYSLAVSRHKAAIKRYYSLINEYRDKARRTEYIMSGLIYQVSSDKALLRHRDGLLIERLHIIKVLEEERNRYMFLCASLVTAIDKNDETIEELKTLGSFVDELPKYEPSPN